jgi:hypothetical protein
MIGKGQPGSNGFRTDPARYRQQAYIRELVRGSAERILEISKFLKLPGYYEERQ